MGCITVWLQKLSLRKCFVGIVFLTGFMLIVVSVREPQLFNENKFIWFNKFGLTRGIYKKNTPDGLPWYFNEGLRMPQPVSDIDGSKLLPYPNSSDRIEEQLMFMPTNYKKTKAKRKLKTILVGNLFAWNFYEVEKAKTLFEHCPVSTCRLSDSDDDAETSDMIIFKDSYYLKNFTKLPNQIYMLYMLECPFHTPTHSIPSIFNWTATYRSDSDIVAPYEKWAYYDPDVKQIEQKRNYASNKTKKVAWFVSNCATRNNRLQYANELSKYIKVDIFGSCGKDTCPRTKTEECFEILDRDYKFYLSFENSNCRDYITEKFYVNGLSRNILPIVMGASRKEYEAMAPQKSFIHVDDFKSPELLAKFLNILDKDDDLYNSYFKWKGTGEFINTHFWCRVCSMLHNEEAISQRKWYQDINEWWRGEEICSKKPWDSKNKKFHVVS